MFSTNIPLIRKVDFHMFSTKNAKQNIKTYSTSCKNTKHTQKRVLEYAPWRVLVKHDSRTQQHVQTWPSKAPTQKKIIVLLGELPPPQTSPLSRPTGLQDSLAGLIEWLPGWLSSWLVWLSDCQDGCQVDRFDYYLVPRLPTSWSWGIWILFWNQLEKN